MDPRRFAIKAANMLTPPIVFEMARKVKEKLSGKKTKAGVDCASQRATGPRGTTRAYTRSSRSAA